MAHVLSRGNGRATVFHSAGDYENFIGLLDDARRRHAVDLFAFCIMPNHFHLVARFDESEQLSEMMQWWLTSHVRRHRKRHETTGHIWQGRFKSFPVQEDGHLLTVLRYVLINPARARLVQSPWGWRWSSLWFHPMLAPWPVPPPAPMPEWLATPCDEEEVKDVRASIRRGAPFGDESWRTEAARSWGLERTLRPLGRPRSVADAALPRQVGLPID